jgi:membrane protein involved in colicin uptake
MNRAVIESIVRHVLTAGGGILVSLGLATPEDVARGGAALAEIVGAVAVLVGIVWGVYDKVRK